MPFVSEKRAAIDTLRESDDDVGSSAVQIARLSARIEELTEHLKRHKKDNHSRYGMIKLVGRRRRLMKYLRRTNPTKFREVISVLGIRGPR